MAKFQYHLAKTLEHACNQMAAEEAALNVKIARAHAKEGAEHAEYVAKENERAAASVEATKDRDLLDLFFNG